MSNEKEESKNEPRLITIPVHIDDRGFLWQLFEREDIKRVYAVGNFDKNTIRGFHLHHEESKWFFVVSGSAKFVIVNEKNESVQSFILSEKRPAVLYVPPGNYNGWRPLEDGTILIGMSDKTLEESKKDDYRADPNKFGDVWSTKNR
jgi:dTDP-4-dehydrorhamnose 3,5-epimerase-like enzyme